ncbi:MAG: hypothetical protein HYW27_02135, partial [Candidatus Aenigmarchaeota archaeon]|nr:hypothetical protein [Candidatus Aenigmarchaeota archaeon]
MTRTRLVIWDIDGVWYPGYSTSHAAKASTNDYRPLLADITERMRLFDSKYVGIWEERTGRRLESVGDVSDMMNDFRYTDMRDSVYKGLSVQEAGQRTVKGKQYLLKGMTLGEVKKAADMVPYTEGLQEAVREIRNAG